MFKHILVPTDGSPLSSDTAQRAIALAKEVGAQVTFFFAKLDYPLAFYGEGALLDAITPVNLADLTDQQATQILDALVALAEVAGVTASSKRLVSDAPYEAIIAAAEQVGADLIFMASHGRRGLGALLLGSETQKLLTHSKLPVLVYR